MDMIFRDDECRVRSQRAPANFTTLKHMALDGMMISSPAASLYKVFMRLPWHRPKSLYSNEKKLVSTFF